MGQKNQGTINITAGKGKKTIVYTLQLSSLFKDMKDLKAIEFLSGKVKNKKLAKKDEKAVQQWEAQVDLKVAGKGRAKKDALRIRLVFDHKIKSVCGFVLKNENLGKCLGHLVARYL